MKNWYPRSNRATRRIIPTACATALAMAFAVSLPVHANKVTPPPVPDQLKVQEGTHPFLVGHAFGTQNYVCAPSEPPRFFWRLPRVSQAAISS